VKLRITGAFQDYTGKILVSWWGRTITQDGSLDLVTLSAERLPDRSAGLPSPHSDRLLVPNAGFSIDANPFHDPQTGRNYLFFATDFESDEPTGTGLATVELSSDLLSVVTEPITVVRAYAAWQVYEFNRQYKGKLWAKWYCVEGPHVIFHEGKYYCFYSAGARYGENYGVSFAAAEHPMGPWYDSTFQDARVLKGIPTKVIGPGHNSSARTPAGTHYLVYHAWDQAMTARRMCIDPIVWTAIGSTEDGPCTTPRILE
jgi:GH43 family beta-xylosidase